jgi:hypothetical protein
MTVNTASRRVMEKCGLALVRTTTYEGADVIEGAEHGEVEYALTKPDGRRGSGAVRGDEGLAERGAPVQDVAAGTAAGDHARVEQHPQVVADSADRQAA